MVTAAGNASLPGIMSTSRSESTSIAAYTMSCLIPCRYASVIARIIIAFSVLPICPLVILSVPAISLMAARDLGFSLITDIRPRLANSLSMYFLLSSNEVLSVLRRLASTAARMSARLPLNLTLSPNLPSSLAGRASMMSFKESTMSLST